MRYILLSVAAAALALPASALGQSSDPASVDPARLAIGRDIVRVVLPPDQRRQMMSSVLDSMLGNMMAGIVAGTPSLQAELTSKPKVKAAMDRFMARQQALSVADLDQALPGLVEAYARAYARTFTATELADIKAFVTTPSGTRFVQRAAALLSDPDVAAWQRQVAAKGVSRQKAELERLDAELKIARADPAQ